MSQIIIQINEDAEIVPARISGEGEVVSVFFSSKPTHETKNFRCINCGKLLFKYNTKLELVVMDGSRPTSLGARELMCGRCRIVYKLV